MLKFTEAIQFVRITGDTSIETIVQITGCSADEAKYAIMVVKEEEPTPKKVDQTKAEIEQIKKLQAQISANELQVYVLANETVGIPLTDPIEMLQDKLEQSNTVLGLAQMASALKSKLK